MKYALITRHGKPDQVTRLEFSPSPELAPDQVRLRWLYAPINPADLNWIEGSYGGKHAPPHLPAIPGMEGLAQVTALGSQLNAHSEPTLVPGDWVIALRRLGSWATEGVAHQEDLWKIPTHLRDLASPESWAQLRVNPLTAWCFLEQICPIQTEDTLLLNAANSSVGQSVLALGQSRGLRIAAFARSHESLRQLKDKFPLHEYFLDTQAGFEEAKLALEGCSIPLACNAVGSESALRQLKLLSEGGTQVTYGGMARQPTRLPAGLLIFKQLTLRGFWVTQWQKQASRDVLDSALSYLAQLLAKGSLQLPVHACYPLEELSQAIKEATQERRQGKILLRLNE